MQPPTIRDVFEARKTIAPYLNRTPLQYSAGLSRLFDAEVYLKHEEHHPLGAFKMRGGINLLAHRARRAEPWAHHGLDRQPRTVDSQRLSHIRGSGAHRSA